jgi:hypothetical protein
VNQQAGDAISGTIVPIYCGPNCQNCSDFIRRRASAIHSVFFWNSAISKIRAIGVVRRERPRRTFLRTAVASESGPTTAGPDRTGPAGDGGGPAGGWATGARAGRVGIRPGLIPPSGPPVGRERDAGRIAAGVDRRPIVTVATDEASSEGAAGQGRVSPGRSSRLVSHE